MRYHDTYRGAFLECIQSRRFAVAHLQRLQQDLEIDTSGCYKIFCNMSGGKKFHIDNRTFEVTGQELFLISPRFWHYFSHYTEEEGHERYVIFLYPEYLKELSTDQTDLSACFAHLTDSVPHPLFLSPGEKERFVYFLQKMAASEGYGSDLLDVALLVEMMVFLNRLALREAEQVDCGSLICGGYSKTVSELLAYLDDHIAEPIHLQDLSAAFYMSESHLCKTFKNVTGTTIHRYITARRITMAKVYLSQGYPISEVGALCGYNDYNAFLKAFTKEVGISPKKYAQFSI